jgi:ribosomal protein bL25 (Ctc-form)
MPFGAGPGGGRLPGDTDLMRFALAYMASLAAPQADASLRGGGFASRYVVPPKVRDASGDLVPDPSFVQEPEPLRASDVRALFASVDTDSILVNLDVDGQTILTLVKDVQRNWLTDNLNHVDFCAVTPDTVVKTRVQVKLVGTPVGTAMGGVVHQIVHEMPVKCAVKDIPCCITADISGVGMKESFRLAQVELPANVSTPFNGTVVLASVIKP